MSGGADHQCILHGIGSRTGRPCGHLKNTLLWNTNRSLSGVRAIAQRSMMVVRDAHGSYRKQVSKHYPDTGRSCYSAVVLQVEFLHAELVVLNAAPGGHTPGVADTHHKRTNVP